MFPDAKVYYDGSHYIAIPKSTVKKKPKKFRKPEQTVDVTVTEEGVKPAKEISELEKQKEEIKKDTEYLVEIGLLDESELERKPTYKSINEQKEPVLQMSRTEIFNSLYEKYKHLSKGELQEKLCSEIYPYFKDKEETNYFVTDNLMRIRRNINSRRNRAWKKARLADFNYFCTFTYDSKKINEEDFRNKLTKSLRNLSVRRSWKYMGVWERGEKTERLHFHSLVHVPEGQMVGEFTEVKDYNSSRHCMQTQLVNSYFGKRFGRTTFEEITPQELDFSLNYILKYIEKTGEKLVYSRGLFMYFQSDILDDDVIMQMSNPYPDYRNEKYILTDNFLCLDEGEIIGNVSSETIRKLRHTNK